MLKGPSRNSVKVGVKFGRLTVISETEKRSNGCKLWECVCVCGKKRIVRTDYLQQGWTKSCGCLATDRALNRLPDLWKSNYKKNQENSVYRFNDLIRNYQRGAKLEDFLLNYLAMKCTRLLPKVAITVELLQS